jgi:uncharacterized protein (DUF433 family)
MALVMSEHIEASAGIAGGRPRIAGHRIRVQDIVAWHERLGLTPDEIVSQCPDLTLADVYAALTYYHDHLDEIRGYLAADKELADALRARTPSKLLKRLAERDAGSDSLSS